MEQEEMVARLKGEPRIKNTPMFSVLSDMNVSNQVLSDYSNSLHNYKLKAGEYETQKRLLDIFRINPLAAVKIMESCSIDAVEMGYVFKLLGYYVCGEQNSRRDQDWPDEPDDRVVLNEHPIPYVVLAIEAAFQNSVKDYGMPGLFLTYAAEKDRERYEKYGTRPKYLNDYNIRHILLNIPDNRQIEFINWFWKSHCFIAKNYEKPGSLDAHRTSVLLGMMPDGFLWRHLENARKQELSPREQQRNEQEKDQICDFIRNVYEEGRHPEYVKKILGEDHFEEKLKELMGEAFSANGV
jgi:hypothetical protein